MLLFAQTDALPHMATLTAFGAAITVIGSTVTALFAFLTAREKYKFDSEKKELSLRVEYMTVQIGVLQEQNRKCEAEAADLHRQIDQLRRRFEKSNISTEDTDEHELS